MGLFRMDKRFKYRHLMLEYLYKKVKHEPLHNQDLRKSETDFGEMALDLNVDPFDLREYHEGFHNFDDEGNEHVICDCDEGGVRKMYIKSKGMMAYLDKHWLKEGIKDQNERIYDTTKWLIPVVALLVTAFALIYSIVTVSHIKGKVKSLEQRLINTDQGSAGKP